MIIEMLLKMLMFLLSSSKTIFVGKRGSSAVSCSNVLLLSKMKSSYKDSLVAR